MSDFRSLAESLDFGVEDEYRRLDLPAPLSGPGGSLLLPALSLERLAEEAFGEIAFRLPSVELAAFGRLAADPGASAAERFVAASLVRNAAIAAEGVFPVCQDTGVAAVYGWKGAELRVEGDEEAALAGGASRAYSKHRLRASVLAPTAFLAEANTGDNLPASLDLRSAAAGSGYRLCFAAKGGGSANRTSLTMASPALLSPEALEAYLEARIRELGPSGCPPYRISFVAGGLAPEEALYLLALAGLGLLDRLPETPSAGAASGAESSAHPALRDRSWEGRLVRIAAATGMGAQFGGSHLALDARAIRLPRHAASLPLALGVSCAARRRARALVNARGIFLEKLDTDPARHLPAELPLLPDARRIDLDRPKAEVLAELAGLPAGTFLLLSGTVALARDAAHARFRARLRSGEGLPDYLLEHPVFYAGPTEAAPGESTGSFGPTTAGRMDDYLEELLDRGAFPVTIAKGGRSEKVARLLGECGGTYLATIGGAAALAAREHVLSSRIVDYPELGMEAVRLVELRELPAMVAIDARGRDFYREAGRRPTLPS